MAILLRSISMRSAVIRARRWPEARGLEDLVFRVGLATRNDYIVSHKRRRILRGKGDSPSSYSYEDVTGLRRGKYYDPNSRRPLRPRYIRKVYRIT